MYTMREYEMVETPSSPSSTPHLQAHVDESPTMPDELAHAGLVVDRLAIRSGDQVDQMIND